MGLFLHFSSFKLSGFKSFVDTVELKIDSGLTGIVGPNGCGKSNLVEAISWAMGENSPSSLRAGAMDNVIFAGSSDRPQRDLAEVTIKINNTDKNAPAQWNSFDTIEVKRSIQRNEGSTYKINDNEIRARDVQTLFADAATGSNSNTIISQGQISNLINMKPTERRIVLEEAAGITGIHTRRREAELRLKAAESNLDRLNDIIETLKSQLTGIKKQSRQASRYKNIATQIRVSEAIISFYRIEEVKDDQKKAEIALKKSKEFLIQATKESSEASNLVTNHTKKIPLLREQQTKDSESLHRLKTAKDMIDIENTRITDEANNVSELCKQIQEDINREKRNTFDARNNLDTLQKEYNDLRKKEVRDNTDTNYGTVNLDKIKKKHSDAEKLLEESQKNLNILETKKSSCLKNIDEHKEKILKLISKEKELKYEIKNLLLLNKSFSNLSILEKQITESSQKIKKNEVAFNEYEWR